jgi:hypothetical protein
VKKAPLYGLKKAILIAFVCISGLAGPRCAPAQPVRFSVSGYAKDLALVGRSFFSDTGYLLNLGRLRTQGALDVGGHLRTELWLDTEVLFGSFLRTPDYAFSRAVERSTLLDLAWEVGGNDHHLVRQQFFRASVTADAGTARFTVGRQRIGWGTGFVWTPTDLLNPVNPAAVERDEKGGVDALYAEVPLGLLTRVEAVYAPGPRFAWSRSSTALRFSTNTHEYDIAVLGGVFRDDPVLGGDFAGYVGNAGLRGEAAYTWRKDRPGYLRLTLNADYTFAGGYYVFVELHHNGTGSRDRDDYDTRDLLDGTIFNLAREYAAVAVARSLTPLFGANVYTLFNLNDGSGLAGPALTWSLSQNLELTASAYVFYGTSGSEFGMLRNVYFGALQYFF